MHRIILVKANLNYAGTYTLVPKNSSYYGNSNQIYEIYNVDITAKKIILVQKL